MSIVVVLTLIIDSPPQCKSVDTVQIPITLEWGATSGGNQIKTENIVPTPAHTTVTTATNRIPQTKIKK